ncbi:hypothetical protein [Roseobacter sp. HKCCA0434]|uniref:hypothetical protein n=1 Tax=Roseobacter sp. HKCCA0434 TaxID=3079297 RepID=UPI002905F6C7|nr:hypothetical protein [Roseobacter sp. HKCCA0434]
MRFRFEVRGLVRPGPDAVEVQAELSGGRYRLLRIGRGGERPLHKRTTHVLSHRPAPEDPLGADAVVAALKR